MNIEYIQPAELPEARYAQAVSVGNLLFLSGQAALDKDGNIVGKGNIEEQAEQIWRNIGHVLRAAGADYTHLVRTTTYLVNMREHYQASVAVRSRFLGSHKVASTLLGIAALPNPEFLMEIDAIAVLA